MNNVNVEQAREKYYEIRRRVWEEATRPRDGNTRQQQENQQRLRRVISNVCDAANLSLYNGTDEATKTKLWHHMWSKIRYAGIRASLATAEIESIQPIFDNFAGFDHPGWDIDASGHNLVSAGERAREFLGRSGPFKEKITVGNIPKLSKTIQLARSFSSMPSGRRAIDFLVGDGIDVDDVWAVHEHLLSIGYTGSLTALHLMMDLGFQVLKPDVVLSRLFLDWGWLHAASPDLPSDLSREDLLGKGRHKNRFHYTKPIIFKPIIDYSRVISGGLDFSRLKEDIGWATNNPIRELDFFIVKAGQLPEKEMGLTRRLLA